MPIFAPTYRVSRHVLPVVVLGVTVSLLAACGSTGDGKPDDAASPSTAQASSDITEQRRATPRLVTTYEGGVLVLDAGTLDVVADLPRDGFLRVNPTGDGRHVAVTTKEGFTMLDTGTWAEPHGDHSHHFTSAPRFTGVTVPAEKAGHVVVHEGRTVFFDDGTGKITVSDSDDVAKADARRLVVDSEKPHHGVAVASGDGSLVRTLGDTTKRVGLLARDPGGREIARTEACPGIHGEAAAKGALVFGCENGAVIYSKSTFRPVVAPDPYGRIGNQAGSPVSPITLGDYKVDKDAKPERPRRVSLIDTRTAALRLVDLPSSYSFRSLARGPRGEALVLGTDGSLHVVDPESGRIERSLPVVAPWEESTDWHDPRPTVFAQGNTAYVTEPSTRRVVQIDMLGWTVKKATVLPHATDEITGVPGSVGHDH